jgi:hypothetical protein
MNNHGVLRLSDAGKLYRKTLLGIVSAFESFTILHSGKNSAAALKN